MLPLTPRESSVLSFWQQRVLFVLLLIALHAGMAQAQNANANNANSNSNRNAAGSTNANENANPGKPSGASAATVACPTSDQFNQVKVTDAYNSTLTGEEKQPVKQVQFGDDLSVVVEHLEFLIQKSECSNPHKKILLFLDGKPLTNLTPFPPTDPSKNLLIFPLKRTDESRDVWSLILGSPSWAPRKTQISVGLEGDYAVESGASVDLEVIPHGWFIFWSFLLLFLIAGFGTLAVKSDVLRDSGPPPPNGARKAYSLARTQAAWWFFIILAAYLFIGIITGDFSTTITGTVLVLLGISAGTVLGSAAIDAGGGAANAAAPPGGAQPNQPANPPAPPTPAEPTTGRWYLDIISDADGVSFHRFQNAVWTLVLGIIFIVTVYRVLAMPQFNEMLLGLMGISAGTYLGLKLNEPK